MIIKISAVKRWVTLAVTFLLVFEASSFANFENYFRELSPEGETRHAEEKIEAALTSVLRRLQVPYVDQDGSIKTSGFFERIESKVKESDPNARVYAAGGVVRSLLGFIYKKVYTAKQKNPEIPTEVILDKIIRSDKEVLSLSALGIGSDLDILIDLSENGRQHKDKVKTEVTEFINSAESKANLRSVVSKLKYAVVPVGDVKDYHDQISRSTGQGGSSLDWLAFPLSGGRMRTPENHPHIFRNFVLGEFDYLPEVKQGSVADPDKQTVRGLRALLEIPFLHLSASGKEQMKRELDALISKVRGGASLSPGALEQFQKMIRNARFEGAHNRFYILDPENRGADREVETLAFQLSEVAPRDDKNIPLIPEFIVNKDPRKRGSRDQCGLKKAGLLMSEEEFLRNHTDQGKLYQGTPKLDNILAIIRNGFVVSSSKQGTAAFGRGAYTTPKLDTARVYGTVVDFRMKNNIHPRVLHWSTVQNHELIKKIEAEASQKNMDIFQYLAEVCDIDIIVNVHTLVENSGVVEIPKNLGDIINLIGNEMIEAFQHLSDERLIDPNLDPRELNRHLYAIYRYTNFYHLGQAIGVKNLRPLPPLEEKYLKLLDHPVLEVRKEILRSLSSYTGNWHRLLTKGLSDSNLEIRREAARLISSYVGPNAHLLFERAFSDADPEVRRSAASSLEHYQGADSYLLFEKALSDAHPDVRLNAENSLNNYKGPDVSLLFEKTFLAENPEVRRSAASALRYYQGPDSHLLFEKALSDANPEVRRGAAKSLEHYQGPHTYPLLEKALSDADPEVRRIAALLLLSYKGPDAHLLFEKALSDADPAVSRPAASALRYYQGPDSHLLFEKAFSNADPEVRRIAALLLRYYQGPDAHLLFEKAFSNADPEVGRDAALVLGSYKGPDSHLLFEKAFLAADPEVRRYATDAIRPHKQNSKILPMLIKLLKNPSATIRQEIAAIIKTHYPGVEIMNQQRLARLKEYLNSTCETPIDQVLSQKNLQEIMDYLNTHRDL